MAFLRSWVALIACVFFQASYAQEGIPVREGMHPLKLLEQGVETDKIQLLVSGQRIVAVEARPCPACSLRRFLPSRQVTVSLNGRVVDGEDLSRLPTSPGVLFINSSSGLVERVFIRSVGRSENQ